MPVLLLLALLGLAACAAPPAAPPSAADLPGVPGVPDGPALPRPEADTCRAALRGNLIGQPVTALERVYILGPVRILRPGDAMTRDYLAPRINFALDPADRILRIFCG